MISLRSPHLVAAVSATSQPVREVGSSIPTVQLLFQTHARGDEILPWQNDRNNREPTCGNEPREIGNRSWRTLAPFSFFISSKAQPCPSAAYHIHLVVRWYRPPRSRTLGGSVPWGKASGGASRQKWSERTNIIRLDELWDSAEPKSVTDIVLRHARTQADCCRSHSPPPAAHAALKCICSVVPRSPATTPTKCKSSPAWNATRKLLAALIASGSRTYRASWGLFVCSTKMRPQSSALSPRCRHRAW